MHSTCVCASESNWCHVFRSDGNKARYLEYCSVCKNVVCPVCSPSGEEISGNGAGQTLKLDDRRIVAPITLRVVTPQRICMQCYMDSYDII